MREVQDHYFRQAKREGYLSRAAYKLIEIDDRRKILSPGDRVLDVGAAPGGWLQVAAERVGSDGIVVGVDLVPIIHTFAQPNVVTIEGDAQQIEADRLLAPIQDETTSGSGEITRFDVVLSDMAPATTGDPRGDHFRSVRLCEALLNRLPQLLRAGGKFVMKVFEGGDYPDLLKRAKSAFETCKGFRPAASRSESVEMYIIARGFRPKALRSDVSSQDDSKIPPRRPRPRTGWKTP